MVGVGVRGGTNEPWLVLNLPPESGVTGDPTAATVERWAELFAGAVEAFCVALAEVVRLRVHRAMSGKRSDLRIDGKRLWSRLMELGEVGEILGPDGEHGCCRLALTDADRRGRDLVVGWMRDLGLDARSTPSAT